MKLCYVILICDLAQNLIAIITSFTWLRCKTTHRHQCILKLDPFWSQIVHWFNLLSSNSHLNIVTPDGTGIDGSKPTVTGSGCPLFSWTEKIRCGPWPLVSVQHCSHPRYRFFFRAKNVLLIHKVLTYLTARLQWIYS